MYLGTVEPLVVGVTNSTNQSSNFFLVRTVEAAKFLEAKTFGEYQRKRKFHFFLTIPCFSETRVTLGHVVSCFIYLFLHEV